jgi:uncharacterized protein YndB with AHSA1/START domain
VGGRRREVGSQGKGVAAMPTTTHTRSVHFDAPVEKVFDHVKDPDNFFAVLYRAHPGMSGQITRRSAEIEEGSTYEWSGRWAFMPIHVVVTRTEYVPNQRIVDQQPEPLGAMTWTHTTAPDATGTTLTLTGELSSRLPLLDKVEDKLTWKGDEDLDRYLAAYRSAIEA